MRDGSESNSLDVSASPEDGETPYFVTQSDEANTEIPTDDIYEEKAMLLVEQLLERGIFRLDDKESILYHEPTGHTFESVINAAHFHNGWAQASES